MTMITDKKKRYVKYLFRSLAFPFYSWCFYSVPLGSFTPSSVLEADIVDLESYKTINSSTNIL